MLAGSKLIAIGRFGRQVFARIPASSTVPPCGPRWLAFTIVAPIVAG